MANSRVYARDALGRFARAVKGRKAKRGLGRRSGRGGRKLNVSSGGGTIGGLPSNQAARKAKTTSAEEILEGSKLRKGK